jgi:hypothetical protein
LVRAELDKEGYQAEVMLFEEGRVRPLLPTVDCGRPPEGAGIL